MVDGCVATISIKNFPIGQHVMYPTFYTLNNTNFVYVRVEK